jgi:hypothetical protein
MLAAANLASGAIIKDDILVVDFGKIGEETAGNWNNAAKAANAQYTANGETLLADLIRYSDGAATGVGLVWDETTGSSSYAGIGGAIVASVGSSASFTGIGTIADSAQVDVNYFNGPSYLQLTGLDNSLTYNLEIMSWIDSARNAQNITVNGTTISIDPDDTNYVTAFNGISATAGGVIQIDLSSTGGSAALQHINALSLTAIPEPTTLGLMGLCGLGVLIVRRMQI